MINNGSNKHQIKHLNETCKNAKYTTVKCSVEQQMLEMSKIKYNKNKEDNLAAVLLSNQ